MKVSEAVERRQSVRAFAPRPVAPEILRDILERALRAPSGGNVQPWRIFVLGAAELARFCALVRQRSEETQAGEAREYAIYPAVLPEPYLQYRRECTEAMYASIQAPRENKAKRLANIARNFEFFGAPVGMFFFIDRRMGPPQWADLGMLMQTIMLLATERGLDTCAQEAWSRWPKLVSEFVEAPEELMLFAGMALGYRDGSHPINGWRTTRARFEDVVTLRGVAS